MTGTYTARGNFYKPAADGSDNVNVVSDLNDNWDRLDALLSWRPATAGTMPASAYQGAAFYQTDTGKGYVNTSSGASAVYVQVPLAGAHFDSGMTFTGTVAASGAQFQSYRTVSASAAYAARVSTDTVDRWTVSAAGLQLWGGGGSSAGDTNLYRVSADVLGTDDSFQVGANLTVSGSATLDDVIIGGNAIVNGATVRPQLHAATTVANSSAETAIATVTIPAGDAVVGSTYRIRVGGVAAVTGTPTMTFRARLGGVSGSQIGAIAAITVRSGMTDGYWDAEIQVTCLSTGASGTWWGFIKTGTNFVTSATTFAQAGPAGAVAATTKDTTAAQDLVLTVQWSAASSSNTITARTGESGRVA